LNQKRKRFLTPPKRSAFPRLENMKFLYLTTKNILKELHYLDGKQQPRKNLLEEYHFIDLENNYVLLSCSFSSEWHQNAWQLHGLVGKLQHPFHEHSLKLEELKNIKNKNFSLLHENILTETLKISSDATIQDISDAAKKINPKVSIGSRY